MSAGTKAKPRTKLHPMEDRVVIMPPEEAESMRGGLYIPDTAKEKPHPGRSHRRLARAGSRRAPGRHGPQGRRQGDLREVQRHPVHARGEEVIIIKASDVLAKIG